ncbi:hypothetical protein [Nocardia asiatica]
MVKEPKEAAATEPAAMPTTAMRTARELDIVIQVGRTVLHIADRVSMGLGDRVRVSGWGSSSFFCNRTGSTFEMPGAVVA